MTNNEKLEQFIFNLLVTSTGKAMMDSGGKDGRNWQHNQKKSLQDFKNDDTVSLDFDDTVINYVTVSLFHYLTSGIIELDDLCNEFNAMPCDDWDGDRAYGVSKAQQEWLLDKKVTIGKGWNTCNSEDLLSQVIQGSDVNLEGNESNSEHSDYVLLQIHQGADIRGGYTDAKLFKLNGYINSCPTVYGSIDDQEVSTNYDGVNLKLDNDEDPKINKDSKISLGFDGGLY